MCSSDLLKAQTFQREQNDLIGWIAVLKEVFDHYRFHSIQKEDPNLFQLADTKIPFGSLLVPWINYLRRKRAIHYFETQPGLRKEFEHSLISTLSKIAAPSFLSFYKSFQKNHATRSKDSYSVFVSIFLKKSFVEFFVEFASLARQLVKLVLQWEEGTNLLFERLEEDKAILETQTPNGIILGNLLHVETNLSTPHSADGQISILHFESGQKWVYKPRSCAPDMVLENLILWLNVEENIPKLRTAKILDKGQYFWQEYIPYDACIHANEFSEYYKRIGCLGALSVKIGCDPLARRLPK